MSGAVAAIAVDPANADIVYIGTVGGGVWKATNALHGAHWTPLTDAFPSLSISALALDPEDPTGRTLYAGTGRVSSSYLGGQGIGLLKTTDGGTTWRLIPSVFQYQTIQAIVPTTLVEGGRVILVGTDKGLYRSKNAGSTFARIGGGLPAGDINVTDVEADPKQPQRFYAAVVGHGIYRSSDGGKNWLLVQAIGASRRIDLSVSSVGLYAPFAGDSPVYAAILGLPSAQVVAVGGPTKVTFSTTAGFEAGDEIRLPLAAVTVDVEIASINRSLNEVSLKAAPSTPITGTPPVLLSTDRTRVIGLLRSGDAGLAWMPMDVPGDTDGGVSPGGQGMRHVSMLADRNSPTVVYVGGDRQILPGTNGATNYTGRLFRGDAASPSGSQWWPITDNAANGTGPHADSRRMVFAADGSIVEADDGGVYRLVDPDGAGRQWESLNGNLALTEFYSVAWNGQADRIIGGAQDVGVLLQNAAGSTSWTTRSQGDGTIVQAAGNSVVYANQNLNPLYVEDLTAASPSQHYATRLVSGTAPDGSATVALPDFDKTVQFVQPYVVNAVDPSRLLIGTQYLYESADLGNTLMLLNGVPVLNGAGKYLPQGTANVGSVRAMIYGGREPDGAGGWIDRPEIGYVGVSAAGAAPKLFVRQPGGANSFTPVPSYDGADVKDIAVDPTDWRRVYVLDVSGEVWFSPNGATSPAGDWGWTRLSENLRSLRGADNLQSIAIVRTATAARVILVGGTGGVFRKIAAGPWVEYGQGMPNALVTDLQYDATDDVLLAGTMGRSAWTVASASSTLAVASILRLTGQDAAADVFEIVRNVARPWMLDIFAYEVGSARPASPTRSVEMSPLQRIDLSGLGGNDVFIIDSTNGPIEAVEGIVIDGGAGDDELIFQSGGAPINHGKLTPAPGDPAAGTHVLEASDAWKQNGRQRTRWLGVEAPPAMPAVALNMDAMNAGMKGLHGAFQGGFADAMGEQMAFVDGRSLAAGLNGARLQTLRPEDDPLLAVSRVAPQGLVQIDNATSILRRLIEEGPGAFLLDSIGIDGAVSTPQALRDALDGLDGVAGNVLLDAISDQDGDGSADWLFDVRIDKTLAGIVDFHVGADLMGGRVELNGNVEFAADILLHLALGMDSTGFFLRPSAGTPELTIDNLTISGAVSGSGQLGFIGVELTNATLSIDPGARIEVNLLDPGAEGLDGLIRMPEMEAGNLASLFAVNVVGDPGDGSNDDVVFDASFRVAAVVPGLELSIPLAEAEVPLAWNDLGVAGQITSLASTPAAQRLLDFLGVSAQDVFDDLGSFQQSLADLFLGADFELPFASGSSFAEVMDVAGAFGQRVMNALSGPAGGAAFDTLQDLVARLVASLGVDPGIVQMVSYDPGSGELQVQLPIVHTFDPRAVQVDPQAASGPGLRLDPVTVALGASADARLVAGLSIYSPVSSFYTLVDQLSGSLTVSAQDIDVSGESGLLGFALEDGALVLRATADIALTDPTPGGRFTPADLQQMIARPLDYARIELDTILLAAAQQVTARLGPADGVHVAVENGQLAIAVYSVFDTGLATQAPPTFALQASGQASLAGTGTALSLSGSARARINNTGQAIAEANIGGSGVDLTFSEAEGDTSSFAVSGHLAIRDFVWLSGSLTFEVSEEEIVATPVGGTTAKSVSVLKVGGSGIHAFAGVGGPYWQDSNGDGVIDGTDAPATAGAAGLALGGVRFALALMTPQNPADSSRYYAMKASAASVAPVGMDAVEIEATNLTIGVNGAVNAADPALNLSLSPITVAVGSPPDITLDFADALCTVSAGLAISVASVALTGTVSGTVSGSGSTWTIHEFTGESEGMVRLAGEEATLNLRPASAGLPLLAVQSVTARFDALDDEVAFTASGLALSRAGEFSMTSASVAGDALLNRFGLGGFLPFDVNVVSVGPVPGESTITFSRFRLNVQGAFDKTVFRNELADPIISVGGLSPTAGGAFTFITEVRDGVVSFPSLNGDVTVGFSGLELGPMTVGATLTLGRFAAGQYILDTVGASATVQVDPSTSFRVDGVGVLTPGAGIRLDMDLALDASFDTGPGGRAQLHMESFHADMDLFIALTDEYRFVDSGVSFNNASVGTVDVRFGPEGDELMLFHAEPSSSGPAVVINIADPGRPFMTFGELSATLPGLNDIPGFDDLTGIVRSFAIGQDFGFVPLDGFGVEFQNLPSAQAFGLPEWFPLFVDQLGLEFGPGALDGSTSNYILILGGGLISSEAFPIDAKVEGLKINVGRLADLFDPAIPLKDQDLLGALEGLSGFEVGVRPIEIGDALKIGGKLGLRLVPHNGRNALVGTIAGFFEFAGFGGGVELTIAQVGPIVAKLDVPLGIPLGPTGLLLEGVSGGFRFGGPAFGAQLPSGFDPDAPPGTIARALLGDRTTFEPLWVSDDIIDAEIGRLLDAGVSTWNLPFTLALTGTFTTVATPGILSGALNLAARVDPAQFPPKVQFLGSGDVTVFGLQVGGVGALLDFSDTLNPTYHMAFAVPSPLNPLGFLFPAQATFEMVLDTDGMIEAPLLGLRTFLSRSLSGALGTVLGRIAERVAEDRKNARALKADLHQPLGDLLGRPLSRLLLANEADPENVTIDASFIKTKLLAALPASLAALNDMTSANEPGQPLGQVQQVAQLASALIAEFYATSEWDQLAGEFLSILGTAASDALLQAWDRFNPAFHAHGELQPIILGIPWGDKEQGGITITKDGFAAGYRTSLVKMKNRIVGAAIPIPFASEFARMLDLGIEDQIDVAFSLEGLDGLFRTLMGGGGFPAIDPDLGFSAKLSGTLRFLGFDLATVSGAAVTANSTLLEFPAGAADNGTFVKVYELREGESPQAGLIPIATEEDYQKLTSYGGLLITGQLHAPELLIDPVGLINRGMQNGVFTPPTVTGPLDLFDFGPYLQRVVDHLLTDKELARIQVYVPSLDSLFDVAIDSFGGASIDLFDGIEAQAEVLMNAAYLRGFLEAQFMSIPLGRASVTAEAEQGLKISANLPWLADAQAIFTLATRPWPLDINAFFQSLLEGLGITGIDLANAGTDPISLPVPVASAVLDMDLARMRQMLRDALGLPPVLFLPDPAFTATLAVYSPGFDPTNASASLPQRNGGIEFDAKMDIDGLAADVSAHFELPLFSGTVAPDFAGELTIDRLSIPGLGIVDESILESSLSAHLRKEDGVLDVSFGGSLRVLGLVDLYASGGLTVDATVPGLYGELALSAQAGAAVDPTLGNDWFSLTGGFLFQVNTTGDARGEVPAGPYLGIHVNGSMTLLDAINVNGVFDLVTTDQGMEISGDGRLVVDLDPVHINEAVSFRILLRADGRVEASFEGFGVTASLDRYGCFRSALIVPGVGTVPFPGLGLLPGACDQHVYVDNQRINETDSDRPTAVRVNLSRKAERDLEFDYRITRQSAGSADLTASTLGTITIRESGRSGSIPVTITGDNLEESDETFLVEITGARYLGLLPPPLAQRPSIDWDATITIVDDDAPRPPQPVTITLDGTGFTSSGMQVDDLGRTVYTARLYEGGIAALSFRALNLLPEDSVQIRYTLTPAPATLYNAQPYTDFLAGARGQSTSGIITLVGEIPRTIDLVTLGDGAYEMDESLELTFELFRESRLAPTTTLSIDAAAIVVVNDDQDQPPGAMVFYDFDAFSPEHRFAPEAHYTDDLLMATDFRFAREVPGSPVFQAAANSALRVDAAAREHARAPIGAGPAMPPGDITIDFWMKPTAAAGRQTVLSFGSNPGLSIEVENGVIYFRALYTTGGTATGALGTYVPDAWQHVAMSYDVPASKLLQEVHGYVNGLPAAAADAGGNLGYGTQAAMLGNSPNLLAGFTGDLDEVRVWTSVLTPAQIATLPVLDVPFTQPGLLINYHLDEAAGTTFANSAGSGWGGTLGSSLGQYGVFGRPDWIDAGDSPVASRTRYARSITQCSGVPKIPPVDPTAEPSFAIGATGWATTGLPLQQSPYYTLSIGRDAPVNNSLTLISTEMRAIDVLGVDFFHRADPTGPTRWELRSSLDGFTGVLASAATDPGGDFLHQRIDLDKPLRHIHPSQPIEFRLYGLDAGGEGGWVVDNFALIGGSVLATTFNRPPTRPSNSFLVRLGESNIAPLDSGSRDPDGDPFVTETSVPAGSGTLFKVAGTWFFTPALTVTKDVVIGVTLTDRWGASTTSTMTARILSNAIDDAYAIDEDASLAGNVLANDLLVAGPAYSVQAASALPPGLTLGGNGSFTYFPPLNFNGAVSFDYVLLGPAWLDQAIVKIVVNPVNDVPNAVGRKYTVIEDTTLTVPAPGLRAGLIDPEGDMLKASLAQPPSRGSAIVNADGSFTYQPNPDEDSTDSFTYLVSDGHGATGPARVDIVMRRVNDPPQASGESYSMESGQTLSVPAPGVLANDFDVDSPTIATKLVATTTQGALILNSNGSFTYTPNAGFTGTDTFTYAVTDSFRQSGWVVARITVSPANLPPVAQDDAFSTVEDTPNAIYFDSLLKNDYDPEGSVLVIVGFTTPRYGTLVQGADRFTYTPSANFNGTDSFTYTIADNRGLTDTATAVITVSALNDPPVARNDSYSVNTTLTASLTVSAPGVLANDFDAERNALSAVLVGNPAHGTLTLNSGGSFTYTPTSGFLGTDAFTYRARDTSGALSGVATASITVFKTGNTGPNIGASVTGIGGYSAYARIALDVNHNNAWDSGEPLADGAVDGSADLFFASTFDLNKNGLIDPAEGVLLLFGGAVTATLLPQSVPLTTPADYSIATPHTTLLVALVTENPALDLKTAVPMLRTALGLPTVSFATYDPIQQTLAGHVYGPPMLVSHVQLHNTYAQLARWAAVRATLPLHQAAQCVMTATARAILQGTIDLTDLRDGGAIGALTSRVAELAKIRINANEADAFGAVIAAGNDAVANIKPAYTRAYVESVYRVEAAAQGPVASAIEQYEAGVIKVEDLIAAYTGSNLSALIASMPLGAVVAPTGSGAAITSMSATPVVEGGRTILTGALRNVPKSGIGSLRINWGDGNAQDVSLGSDPVAFQVEHVYEDNHPAGSPSAPVSIGVALMINGTPTDICAVTTTVSNVVPSIQDLACTSPVTVGTPAAVSGRVRDPGIHDIVQLQIAWGDGQTTAKTLGGGGDLFLLDHPYSAPGAYTITVIASDGDTGISSQQVPAAVLGILVAPWTIEGNDGASTLTFRRAGTDLQLAGADGATIEQRPIASTNSVAINALGGNDDVSLDFSGGSPAPVPLAFDGGTGTNTLRLAALPAGQAVSLAPGVVGVGETSIAVAGVNLFDVQGAGNPITVAAGQRLRLSGTAVYVGSGSLESLQLAAGASLGVAGPIELRDLTLDAGAVMNLGNAGLLLRCTPEEQESWRATLTAFVAKARNTTPLWTATGITSSAVTPLTTLAVRADGDEAVTVSLALYGDLDGDGQVNGDDYHLMDLSWIRGGGTGFEGGDLNYDLRVDGDDYFLVDSAYLGQTAMSSVAIPASAKSVPVGTVYPASAAVPALAPRLSLTDPPIAVSWRPTRAVHRGYGRGALDHDGVIDGRDYFLIGRSILLQEDDARDHAKRIGLFSKDPISQGEGWM